MATWFRGGARKVCQVGSLEVTVGPQGGWLPNFLDGSWAVGKLGILGSQRFEAQRLAVSGQVQWKRAVLLLLQVICGGWGSGVLGHQDLA